MDLEGFDQNTVQIEYYIKLGLISLFLCVGALFVFRPPRHTMPSLQKRIDREFPDVPKITSRDLAAWLADSTRPQPLIFDVRTSEEYAVSHLPGATLLEPGTPAKICERQFGGPKEAVLYCSVGYRASEMARELMRSGWKDVAVLRGSIFQWANENRPLEANGKPTTLVHPYSFAYAHLIRPQVLAPLPKTTLFLNHLPPLERWRLGLSGLLLLIFLTWESLAPAFHWFRNGPSRVMHGWRNYLLGFINIVLAGLLFVQAWLMAASWADTHRFGLLNIFSLTAAARLIVSILLLDFWTYSWHWINHHVKFLWRFHRTHHTELNMDVTSAVRFHFGEIVLSGLLRIPLIILFGLQFHELVIYEMLLFAIVQFHHANIRLPAKLDRLLSWFIASPGFHRVHHSPDWAMANSNYSSFLSIWDRIFRTASPRLFATNPQTNTQLQSAAGSEPFGVVGMESPEHHTLIGLIETPLESDGQMSAVWKASTAR
jgi:sterol desaturase/sphingolipid hydroxylase (fatty acid hydroxylase superfamily)/rhodanese-related sulfurtransferase